MRFEDDLADVLPPDLPNREVLIEKGAAHLRSIVEANRRFNLTRITDSREAAIKHVFDSVYPWRYFEGSTEVLDAGTGAGFPGVPLAIIFPATRFLLSESVGKKARFTAETVKALGLKNVEVRQERAEQILHNWKPTLITARALAPIPRALTLFQVAIRARTRALLYKGPDADSEIATVRERLSSGVVVRILQRYKLPDEMGARTLVGVERAM